jgi:hypothetical protein
VVPAHDKRLKTFEEHTDPNANNDDISALCGCGRDPDIRSWSLKYWTEMSAVAAVKREGPV